MQGSKSCVGLVVLETRGPLTVYRVRIKGVRNLPRPLVGADKVATFVAAFGRRPARPLETRECELNGLPVASATCPQNPR